MQKYKMKKKRDYITAFGNNYKLPYFFKKIIKKDNKFELIINKISSLDIEQNKLDLKELNNINNIMEFIVAIILTKYNLYYEIYLENKKPKKYNANKTNKNISSKYNESNTKNNNINQNKPLGKGNNLNDDNSSDNNTPPNNNNNIISEKSIITKKYVNSELYPLLEIIEILILEI